MYMDGSVSEGPGLCNMLYFSLKMFIVQGMHYTPSQVNIKSCTYNPKTKAGLLLFPPPNPFKQ